MGVHPSFQHDHGPFLAKVDQRDREAAGKGGKSLTPTPEQAAERVKQSKARWAKPLPHTHRNFIPAQSWLAYNWLDKDPQLDEVKAAIEDSGMTLEQIEHETEKMGHRVSRYTLIAWYFGETKRPQNCTMNTVMSVLGYERQWKKTH
jgi:hypothetical protein